MNESKHMTLGLDLGIASVGWCLFDSDDNENPRRILDIGSFVFNQVENPKDGKRENAVRREKRLARRQRRRKSRRLNDGKDLFLQTLGVDLNETFKTKLSMTPFEIKIKGLNEKLSKEELCIALYHYLKYRGFKSNRKDTSDKKADSLLLKKITEVKLEAEKKNIYITQLLWGKYLEELNNNNGNAMIHNHNGEYHLTVDREEYKCEIIALLDKQIYFGLIDEQFKIRFVNLFERQRSYSKGPANGPYVVDYDKVRGVCRFDENKRELKDSYSATAFRLASLLNNFRYKTNYDDEYKKLSVAEIKNAFTEILKAKKEHYTCGDVVKFSGIDPNQIKSIKSVFLSRKTINNLRKDIAPGSDYYELLEKRKHDAILGEKYFSIPKLMLEYRKSFAICDSLASKDNINHTKRINYIADVLFKNKTDKDICDALKTVSGYGLENELKFDDDDIKKICKLPDATMTIELSRKLCDELLPIMLQGKTYDKAMNELGYDHSIIGVKSEEPQKIPEINTALKELDVVLNNPVVKHTLVQMRRIINSIVDCYGYPTSYVVELARELKKDFEKRKEIRFNQIDSRNDNLNLKLEMMSKYPTVIQTFSDASRKGNLIKYKLFKLQKGMSPYTGKVIDESKLFDCGFYEVDHIIPYSRSFDDSLSNKVLVEAEENRNKRDRTPWEYFHEDKKENDFKIVEDFASGCCNDFEKRNKLLLKKYDASESGFANADSSDTGYIALLARDLIDAYLLPKSKCKTVSGAITAKLRTLWRISGRTHSYYSSYRKYYKTNDVSNFKYKDMILESDKNGNRKIVFVFNCRNQENQETEYNFVIKENKTTANKTFDEHRLNDCVKNVINNFVGYKDKFNNIECECDIDQLLHISHHISDNNLLGEYDENIAVVLAEVYKQIDDECNRKNRDNDLHHALDAAVIGCVNPSIIKRVSDFYKDKENPVDFETGEVKFEMALPYKDFDKEVLLRVYERDQETLVSELNKLDNHSSENMADLKNTHVLWPTRLPDKEVVGPVSNETIYGVRGDSVNHSCVLVKRVDVKKLKNNDSLKHIYDKDGGNKAIYNACQTWLDTKVERPLYPILHKKNGFNFIKSVLLEIGKPGLRPELGTNRFADNADCVRVDVYKNKTDKSDDKLYFVPVYYYQIYREKMRKKDPNHRSSPKYAIISDTVQEISGTALSELFEKKISLNRYSLVKIEYKTKSAGTVSAFAYCGGVTTTTNDKGKSNSTLEVYSMIGDNSDLFNCKMPVSDDRCRLSISAIKNIILHNISALGKIS